MKGIIRKLLIKWPNLGAIVIYIYRRLWLYDIKRNFGIPFQVHIDRISIDLIPEGQIAKVVFMKKFEPTELNIFSKLIRPGMIVVDAGANIGLYSLLASKLVGDSGQVFSFEPSVETYLRLSKNIQINKSKNINAINCGLGDSNDQELVLRQDLGYEDAERYMVPSDAILNKDLENVNDLAKSEKVSIVRLDSYLETQGISKIDFMKIDTEGFEYYVLNGAKEILSNSDQLVILFKCTELGTKRANINQRKVFDILHNSGFGIYYWDDSSNSWNNDVEGCFSAGELWAAKSINKLTDYIC